jgi:2-aminoadipate transaminase
MNLRLSRYGQASTVPSPVNRMMASFAGSFRDGFDCNLGVGYVNEETIPVDGLTAAMQAVAAHPEKYRQAFNYGTAEGSANLIASLRCFLGRQFDAATLASKRLVAGPCGATSVLAALADLLEPGVVVTSDPAYYIYTDALERKGFEVLAIPEDQEGIDLERLEAKLAAAPGLANRISFLYVVTVNNPSCTILSNARRRALLEFAARLTREQGRPVPVIYDIAYELLLHDPARERFRSVLPDDELGIAYEIGTLSKVLAPALRVGYILGPDGPLLDALAQWSTDSGLGGPLFVQEMASYLLDCRIDAQLAAVNAGYRTKAVAVREGIERQLGALLADCRGGSAGFYFYLTFLDLETHPESPFFERLTSGDGPRVIYIPGVYCVHPRGDLAEVGKRQLRLSYGFEDAGRILEALALMRAAAK